MLFRFMLPAAALMLAATAAVADCKLENPPRNVPSGKTATEAEMMAAYQEIVAYNTKVNEYTDCLKTELDAAIAKKGPKITEKERKSLEGAAGEKHNAAMGKVEELAQRFNEQRQVYNARPDVIAAQKKEAAPAQEPAK